MIFHVLSREYGWLPEEILGLTMNQVRVYLSDEAVLAGKMKFKTQSEMQAYQALARNRIADIADHISLRMREV